MIRAAPAGIERLRVNLGGAVQGVGFRPTVYRLATGLSLSGWVRNSTSGLVIEVEGRAERLSEFLDLLERERPRAALITSRAVLQTEPQGSRLFEILPSVEAEPKSVSVPADMATCRACLTEINNPADRRFEYAFTNCTACGPRYTILQNIPYDRTNTTMRAFTMCPACRREYETPVDRRFHAQPNACPRCGPHVWMDRRAQGKEGSPFVHAAAVLACGEILALKGIGGFQLLVDALNETAVERMRRHKRRQAKPFAVLMPSLEMAREFCALNPPEEELLLSAGAPIVLLRTRAGRKLAANVSKSSPYIGVMLPYSPLHHLLTKHFPHPLVATSGNLSEEPIATDNEEARQKLFAVADAFLMHDRPIVRPCDDSVARVSRGEPQLLRRARGYAPLPVVVPTSLPPVLAVGGHLKNTVAIGAGREVFLSQHIGDLDTLESRRAFERAIQELCRLYRFKPELVACDLHPDYASARWAAGSGLPMVRVQHHHAHVAACAAENGIESNYLGVAWDGTGYGLDGTIWGGEFFLVRDDRFDRIAHLRPFRLPGGEAAVRQGWRPAASLLFETFGVKEMTNEIPAASVLRPVLERGVHAPWTSSVGRLFDAVAYLAGIAEENQFEGQAAMNLERAIGDTVSAEAYQFDLRNGVADWSALIADICADRQKGADASQIAARFHNALANWIVEVSESTGVSDIVLSGGVFQNGYLSERVCNLLEARGLRVLTHRQVPPNDGGIALGQAVLAARCTS